MIAGVVGKPVPHEVVSVLRWVARDLVADRYRGGPRLPRRRRRAPEHAVRRLRPQHRDGRRRRSRLEARGVLEGWGGRGCSIPTRSSAGRWPSASSSRRPAISCATAGGRRIPRSPRTARRARRRGAQMGEAIVGSQASVYLTDGTALGNVYEPSPIVLRRRHAAPAPQSISEYRPTTRPGARAPHAWLPDGRSTLDLFGRGFVLLRLGDGAPDCAAFEAAFARRACRSRSCRSPIRAICELYERRLVLVRPDGHVAWRGDARTGRSARRGRSRARRGVDLARASRARACLVAPLAPCGERAARTSQHNGMGEGCICVARFARNPSPNLNALQIILALSHKGRATVLAVKRFAMVFCP